MKRAGVALCFLVGLIALLSLGPATDKAEARPNYYTDATIGNCVSCHGPVPPTGTVPATCDGCHAHGTHSSSAKNDINIAGATDKATYTPGETVSVRITGGYRNNGTPGAWVRAILYDQSMTELARSTGTATGGMGGGQDFPITLTAPAPTTPGAYTWNVAWYGNQFDLGQRGGTTFFGPRWTPDPNNPNHGQEIVATNSFTVAAPTAPAITLNPASLSFGSVNVGSVATRTTQIQNTGTADLNITAIARAAGTSTEYTFTPAAPLTIIAGGSMTLSVTYTPTDTGTDTGSLVITSNASTSPTSLQVTGTGAVAPPPAQPTISLSLAALDFGTATVGGVPAVRTTLIQNTGTADLSVTGIAPTPGTSTEFTFAPETPLPLTIAPGANKTLTVTYTPVDAGADTGSFTIASNDPSHPSVTLTVTGIGTVTVPSAPAIKLNPASLAFGTVDVGTTKTLTTQVQNTGTADLNVTGISLCAGTPTEFSWSLGTTTPVAPGGSVTLSVSFNPVDADSHTGCLTIASNDPAAPSVTLAVTAAGQLPPPGQNPQPGIELQPTTLDFGTVVAGGSVSTQLKITNTGMAPLNLSSIALCSGTSTEFSWSPSAPLTIAAGAEKLFTVTYTPLDVGTDTGCLEIASNDPVTPLVQVDLSGTGAQPSSGLNLDIRRFRATEEVHVGEEVEFQLVVRNAGKVEGQAPATLVGVQNGGEVYNQTITVSAPVGRKVSSFTFPPFTPTATGKIKWTVTIQDQSKGRNRATAVTEVKRQKEKDKKED